MTLPTIDLKKLPSEKRNSLPLHLNRVEREAESIRKAISAHGKFHSPNLSNATIRHGEKILFCNEEGKVFLVYNFRSKNQAREYNRVELKGRAYRAEKLAKVTFDSHISEEDKRSWSSNV